MYRGFIHPFITGFGAAPLYLPSWAPGWRQMANDGNILGPVKRWNQVLNVSSCKPKVFCLRWGEGIPKPTEKVFFKRKRWLVVKDIGDVSSYPIIWGFVSQANIRIPINQYQLDYTRWWFQTFFIFTPTWGDDPIWLLHIFQRGWTTK